MNTPNQSIINAKEYLKEIGIDITGKSMSDILDEISLKWNESDFDQQKLIRELVGK